MKSGYKVKCPRCGLSTKPMPRADAVKLADRHTFVECKAKRTKPAVKESKGLGLVDRAASNPRPPRRNSKRPR